MSFRNLLICSSWLLVCCINSQAQETREICVEDSIYIEQTPKWNTYEFSFGPLYNISIQEFGMNLEMQYQFRERFGVSGSFGLFPYSNDIFEYYLTAKVNSFPFNWANHKVVTSLGYSYLHWLNYESYPKRRPEGFHNLLLGLEYRVDLEYFSMQFGYQYLSYFHEHIVLGKISLPVFRAAPR